MVLMFQDTGEPGWWRGEINGKEGVFPDNFVALLPETDKEVNLYSLMLLLMSTVGVFFF